MSGQSICGRGSLVGLLFVVIGITGPALATDYTVSVEPSYPAQQAHDVYQPLLEYLSKATGQRFVLHYPSNYHLMWRDIRYNPPADFSQIGRAPCLGRVCQYV